MKILLLTILLQIAAPQYEFKSTSGYIQGRSETPKVETNINYQPSQAGPRKVSGLDGWITWITWGQFNGVPSSASNEDMYDFYSYIQSGGTLNYDDWWDRQHNPLPIDNTYILILFACAYAYRKAKFTT